MNGCMELLIRFNFLVSCPESLTTACTNYININNKIHFAFTQALRNEVLGMRRRDFTDKFSPASEGNGFSRRVFLLFNLYEGDFYW